MDSEIKTLVASYQPSQITKDLVASTPLVMLAGISGAGKDTILRRMMETGDYVTMISHTTRAPRENGGVLEQDGREYHFITKEHAVQMLQNGDFVEAKEYGGNLYGTSAAEVQKVKDSGKVGLNDIEIQGIAEYKLLSSNVIAIFILPPDFTEWQRRLQARYGDSGPDAADMRKRMETAIVELEEALRVPYYHFVINDDLENAVTAANKIAHKHDEFNIVDKSFHIWAERLLEELRGAV